MKMIHREQPKVEDVMFVPVVEQVEMPYRGMEGGAYEVKCLPEDTMEGLQVSEWIPEGFYAEIESCITTGKKVNTDSQT